MREGTAILDWISDSALAVAIGIFGGILLGLAARIGRFCTLGAIEDVLYAGMDTRIRMWVLAIGLAMVGTFGLAGLGWFDASQVFYHTSGWSPVLSIAGGLLFGYGMALAGACGFGALARFGGGDLRAFVIVMVMGITAYATLSGPLARLRVWATEATMLPTGSGGYAELIGSGLGLNATIVGVLIGVAIVVAALYSASFRAERSAMIWAAIVAVAIVSGWAGTQWIASNGFDGVGVVSHTYSAPMGDSILYVMTASGGGYGFGVGSVFGVLVGALAGSFIKGHFRWEACEDPRELKRQILGAAFMGVGAIMALGCTIGQGISAFSVLAFSAPIVFASIFAGAAIGLRQLILGSLAFR